MNGITGFSPFLFVTVIVSLFFPFHISAAPSVTIAFWEEDGADQQAVLDEAIAGFMKANPDITVTRTHYEIDELRTKYASSSASEFAPDVVLGSNDNLKVFIPCNLVAPIDQVVGEDYLKEFAPVALDCAMYDGKQYMLPDRLGNELCLIINKKLVDKVPATWDELVATGMKLKKEKKADYPLAFQMFEPFFSVSFFGAFDVRMFDNPGSAKAKPTLNTPQMLEWCRFLVKLQKDEIIPSECDYDYASNLFIDGKVPFLINGPWSFEYYSKSFSMDLIIAPIPPINGKFPAPLCAVKGYTVSKNVMKDNKKKRAVSLFVRHMTGKKVQLDLNSIYKQLPSLKAAAADQVVLSDPLISGQKAQLEKSVPMPIIAQMRAIWDAIKSVQRELLSGEITPEAAPALMQKRAEEGIKTFCIDLK